MSGHSKRIEASDELVLIGSIAAGDSQALAVLYDRYAGLLTGMGMKILGDKAEVEDLLHDVFVEVWQKAGSYDPVRGTVRTWLCLRMRSRALDRCKLSRRARSESLADAEGTERSVPDHTSNPDHQVLERGRLKAALEGLPDPQRQVISLAYFLGHTCSEIAVLLDLPIGTVKSRLAGARKGLERAMNTQSGASL